MRTRSAGVLAAEVVLGLALLFWFENPLVWAPGLCIFGVSCARLLRLAFGKPVTREREIEWSTRARTHAIARSRVPLDWRLVLGFWSMMIAVVGVVLFGALSSAL